MRPRPAHVAHVRVSGAARAESARRSRPARARARRGARPPGSRRVSRQAAAVTGLCENVKPWMKPPAPRRASTIALAHQHRRPPACSRPLMPLPQVTRSGATPLHSMPNQAPGAAEAGHHLVVDVEDAVAGADLPGLARVLLGRHRRSRGCAQDRLGDEGRHRLRALAQDHRLELVRAGDLARRDRSCPSGQW